MKPCPLPPPLFPARSGLKDFLLQGGQELRQLLPAVGVAEREPGATGQTRREALLRDEALPDAPAALSLPALSLPALSLPAQP
jgi:hypothetical protein